MLIVAFLFAVSINFDKIAMLNSDPFFGMGLTVLAVGGALLIISAYSFRKSGSTSFRNPGNTGGTTRGPGIFPSDYGMYLSRAAAIGTVVAIEAASINIAYNLQIVPYVIEIKRLSILFVVIFGTLVFSEHETGKRLAGAALMVTGAIIIMLFA
jgi:uncharacterized membrane protein